jgi:hypothetical protein
LNLYSKINLHFTRKEKKEAIRAQATQTAMP